MSISKGTQVRQRVTVIEGTVTDRRLAGETDEVEYLVAYTDEAGESHERWFLGSQLETGEAQ